MSNDRHELVFFDLETGGLDPARHPIIQFAGVAVDAQWREVEAVEMKIHFDLATAEQEALRLNGWNADIWKREAVGQLEAMERVADFFRRHATLAKVSAKGTPYTVARLAGHNIERFDCLFLVAWFKSAGSPARPLGRFCPAACYEPLDTLSLARWLSFVAPTQPESHTLGSLCEWLGIEHEAAHDALGDVRATVAVARALSERLAAGWGAGLLVEALRIDPEPEDPWARAERASEARLPDRDGRVEGVDR